MIRIGADKQCAAAVAELDTPAAGVRIAAGSSTAISAAVLPDFLRLVAAPIRQARSVL